jgi:SAM-dependent methyltransferase
VSNHTSYHDIRFQFDPRRNVVWREIIRYLSRKVDLGNTVLDVGCGYGEFINNVSSEHRYALDASPEMKKFLDPKVTFVAANASATEDSFPLGKFDFIFSSNLLEHLKREEIGPLLASFRKLLKPGGHVGILMPNYRLASDRYFDDYTHQTAVSDVALCDWMIAEGLEVIISEPGFMPFSMKGSAIPVNAWLVRCWLRSPIKPGAGQMLIVGRRPPAG